MKDYKQRHCETMGFNCPNLVPLFICTGRTELAHRELGIIWLLKECGKGSREKYLLICVSL